MDAPELKKKADPITLAMILVVGLLGIEIGILISGQSFNLAEVGGVRSDMNKQDTEHTKRIDDHEIRIRHLEEEVLKLTVK